MRNKLFTLAGALLLAAVIGGVYSAPALSAVIKAALVKNIDEKGRSPYTEEFPCNGVASCSFAGAAVSNGQRLVIEHVSGTGRLPSGANIAFFDVQVLTGSPVRRAALEPHYRFTISGQDDYQVNDDVLIYVEQGDKPVLGFTSATSGPVQARVVMSGYFIDLNN